MNNFGTSTSAVSATGAALQFGGHVHGGNQAVTNAAVTLWAAGAPTTGGGYGTGATKVASTTTDGNGSFTFNTAGVSPCTTGQYLYITAVGGNTGAGTNSYSAMMAALPTPCSATTGSTYVWINEVTTVAAVWSLQQFMSITPGGATPWVIGAPSTNITGLANAFAGTSQLAALATGTAAVSTVTNTVATNVYTTTITPDISRIDTIADILAACVNTAGTSTCTSLFADTTPGSATAPTDTIQAAYYMATNPGGLTMNAHSQANSPTYLCNQYVAAAGSPFLPALTCGTNTNDWLIGVSWKAVNPAAATVGTIDAASVAIDAGGNVWTGAGSGVTGNIVNEFNPSGLVIITPVSTVNIPAYNVNEVIAGTGTPLAYAGSTGYTVGYARPFGLAIDTTGNAWFNAYGSTSPGTLSSGTVTLPTGVLVEVAPGGTASGLLTTSDNGAIAMDGSNNIYTSGQPVSGRYYISELTSASTYQTLNEGNARATAIYNYLMVDSNQNAWGFSSSTTCTNYTIFYLNSTIEAAQTASATGPVGEITDPSACAYYAAPDASGNAWATAGGNLYYINVGGGANIGTPTITTFTGSTNASATGNGGTGGLDNATGVAVDGVGNVWVVNRLSSSLAGGVSEFVPTTSGTTTTVTALSPGGSATSQAGEFGFQVDGAAGVEGAQIDASGNLWLSTTAGSYLYHMVGAAAPVVTPVSLALSKAALGTKP